MTQDFFLVLHFCNVKPKFQNLIKQEQNMFNHIPKAEWLMHNVITLWELGFVSFFSTEVTPG